MRKPSIRLNSHSKRLLLVLTFLIFPFFFTGISEAVSTVRYHLSTYNDWERGTAEGARRRTRRGRADSGPRFLRRVSRDAPGDRRARRDDGTGEGGH